MTPVLFAKSYLGTKEFEGPADNPKIMEMYRSVGHDWVEHDEVAWCAAFVGHCLERSGLRSSRNTEVLRVEAGGVGRGDAGAGGST